MADAIVAACHHVGFCYLLGHHVDSESERAALRGARDFFALGDESKRQVAIGNTPHFRGYTPFGEEFTKGCRDWREQIDLGLDQARESAVNGDPPWRRLRGPNQWPASLPQFRAGIESWMDAMHTLSIDVLRLLATGLGQDKHHFDQYMLPDCDPHLKVIRYLGVAPPDSAAADGVPGQGVGWHQDSGLLTFILEDGTRGLQVRLGDAVLDAGPVDGAYLMNLGEMLQRATNGYLRATEHRVVSPAVGTDRVSLAYFAHPRFEAVFEPIELPPELAARARGADNEDPADPVHRCFGDNYLKIRLRSHPDVAARFYSDVRL